MMDLPEIFEFEPQRFCINMYKISTNVYLFSVNFLEDLKVHVQCKSPKFVLQIYFNMAISSQEPPVTSFNANPLSNNLIKQRLSSRSPHYNYMHLYCRAAYARLSPIRQRMFANHTPTASLLMKSRVS